MNVRALAYQYLKSDCSDEERKFAEKELKLPAAEIFGVLSFKYSYPDLQLKRLDSPLFQATFNEGSPRLQLDGLYTVYTKKQNSDHLGFRIALVLELSGEFDRLDDLRDYLRFSGEANPQFKDEITPRLKKWLGRKSDLPVVLFLPDSVKEDLLNDSVWASVPSGRSVRLERGFPYLSYVVHSEIDQVLLTDLQRCDLAMLLALPAFVEAVLFEKVRDYRTRLKSILQEMRIPTTNIEQTLVNYRDAWSNFEAVDVLIPRMNTAMQRMPQKYGESTFLTIVASDNDRLIEKSISPAITATEQVRAVIEAVVNQALEGATGELVGRANKLQRLILALGLVAIVAPIAWDYFGPAKEVTLTRADSRIVPRVTVDMEQPLGIQLRPVDPASIRLFSAVPLFGITKSQETSSRTLVFDASVQELSLDIFLESVDGSVPTTVTLSKDTATMFEFPVPPNPSQNGVRVYLRKPLFEPRGGSFVLNVLQGRSLRTVPISVRFR